MKTYIELNEELKMVQREFNKLKVTSPIYDDMASRYWTLIWVLDIDVEEAAKWVKK